MMDDPIPVEKSGDMSVEDRIKLANATRAARAGTVILVTACVVVLCLFVPLGVFLTRLAMGL